MTVASFIAAERTDHGVPHAKCCRWLLAWAATHRDELVRNWDLARQGLPHEAIAPTIEEEA